MIIKVKELFDVEEKKKSLFDYFTTVEYTGVRRRTRMRRPITPRRFRRPTVVENPCEEIHLNEN